MSRRRIARQAWTSLVVAAGLAVAALIAPAAATPLTGCRQPESCNPSVLSNPGNGLSRNPHFFPLTVWLQTPQQHAQDYRDIGINVFNNLYDGVSAPALDALKKAHLWLMQDGQTPLGIQSSVLRAWEQVDEPDDAQPDGQGGYGPCIAPSTIIDRYHQYKRDDPRKRPVYLNLGRGVADVNWVGRGSCTGRTDMYADYAKGADIVSFDIYPRNQGVPLHYVAQGVDNLRRWTGYRKPVWAFIETTDYGGTQGPSPTETRAEAWMALVHGANGISYFAHIFSPQFIEAGLLSEPEMSAAVKSLNTQITALAPVLNRPSAAVDVMDSTHVDSMVKSYGGATYLFTVETRGTGTSATATVPGVRSGTATVIGEHRTIRVRNGKLSDSFDPYAVHLYRIRRSGHTQSDRHQ